ncbi:hypothetical protein FHR72_001731 [Mycolicibacterium iranicum]|uniref:4Fe-4S Wbl-type domain-containing protein n=1 Tax=Mycolicibacterium iranicum TaxID=912594 RepID=A0A839Q480_MYCIR|nr:hypothetical protein [Mycolicibacterium iranicum]MBB2990263.1 hypothetical protein [Mycolicibacterium iranicum]
MTGPRRRTIVGAPWITLLAAILRDVPRLDGALCAGQPGVFDGRDGRDGEHTREAIALCAQCPAHTACSEWWGTLGVPRRPRGVVAGRWRGSTSDDADVGDAAATTNAVTAVEAKDEICYTATNHAQVRLGEK